MSQNPIEKHTIMIPAKVIILFHDLPVLQGWASIIVDMLSGIGQAVT